MAEPTGVERILGKSIDRSDPISKIQEKDKDKDSRMSRKSSRKRRGRGSRDIRDFQSESLQQSFSSREELLKAELLQKRTEEIRNERINREIQERRLVKDKQIITVSAPGGVITQPFRQNVKDSVGATFMNVPGFIRGERSFGDVFKPLDRTGISVNPFELVLNPLGTFGRKESPGNILLKQDISLAKQGLIPQELIGVSPPKARADVISNVISRDIEKELTSPGGLTENLQEQINRGDMSVQKAENIYTQEFRNRFNERAVSEFERTNKLREPAFSEIAINERFSLGNVAEFTVGTGAIVGTSFVAPGTTGAIFAGLGLRDFQRATTTPDLTVSERVLTGGLAISNVGLGLTGVGVARNRAFNRFISSQSDDLASAQFGTLEIVAPADDGRVFLTGARRSGSANQFVDIMAENVGGNTFRVTKGSATTIIDPLFEIPGAKRINQVDIIRGTFTSKPISGTATPRLTFKDSRTLDITNFRFQDFQFSTGIANLEVGGNFRRFDIGGGVGKAGEIGRYSIRETVGFIPEINDRLLRGRITSRGFQFSTPVEEGIGNIGDDVIESSLGSGLGSGFRKGRKRPKIIDLNLLQDQVTPQINEGVVGSLFSQTGNTVIPRTSAPRINNLPPILGGTARSQFEGTGQFERTDFQAQLLIPQSRPSNAFVAPAQITTEFSNLGNFGATKALSGISFSNLSENQRGRGNIVQNVLIADNQNVIISNKFLDRTLLLDKTSFSLASRSSNIFRMAKFPVTPNMFPDITPIMTTPRRSFRFGGLFDFPGLGFEPGRSSSVRSRRGFLRVPTIEAVSLGITGDIIPGLEETGLFTRPVNRSRRRKRR